MTRLIFSLALLATCMPALAEPMLSGPIGILFFLLLTPLGWFILGGVALAIVALIVRAARRD